MEIKDIKNKEFFTIWWSFFWRYLFFSMLFASLAGGLGALIIVKLGYPESATLIKNISLMLGTTIASFIALKSVFFTKFKDYSIVLMKTNN
jgi:hypothetical protein